MHQRCTIFVNIFIYFINIIYQQLVLSNPDLVMALLCQVFCALLSVIYCALMSALLCRHSFVMHSLVGSPLNLRLIYVETSVLQIIFLRRSLHVPAPYTPYASSLMAFLLNSSTLLPYHDYFMQPQLRTCQGLLPY